MICKIPPLTIYLLMRGASGLFFSTVFTLGTLYRVDMAGLNPLQLVLVGTVLESFAFAFEIPTGVVADLYSRKLSLVIGFAIIGAGFVLEGSLPVLWAILLAQAVWAIGYTFTSGADSAWIADEIGTEKAPLAFMRGSQASQIGALLGIAVSTALGNISLAMPIVVGGVAFIALAVFLQIAMPETGFSPVPRHQRNTWRDMFTTFGNGLQAAGRNPVLRILLLVGVFMGLSSEGIDRLWQVHMLSFPLPVAEMSPATWFGLLSALASIISIIGVQLVVKRVKNGDPALLGLLIPAISALFMISIAVFALAGDLTLAVTSNLAYCLFRRLNGPLHSAWINQIIPSPVRATVLSIGGQLDSLGQIAGGPLIGLVAARVSIPAALLISALLLLPVPLMYRRAHITSLAMQEA